MRRHRQLNVQQQNQLDEASMRATAFEWRVRGVPQALERVGSEHGVDFQRSMVVHLELEFPGMAELSGTLLTQDERFIEFEIETRPEIEVLEWNDVTHEQNLSEHNRGTGVGAGALALKVLRELNGDAPKRDLL